MIDARRQLRFRPAGWLAILVLPWLLWGCAGAPPDMQVVQANYDGQYGLARAQLLSQVGDHESSKDDIGKDYLLRRTRLMMTMLADGYAPPNSPLVNRVYDILRTQGINRNNGVVAVAVNEDLKIWKGEPFEQALAFHYIAMYEAETGSWDNARAAIGDSLFQLKEPVNQQKDGPVRTLPSNFALGYLMSGICNQQVARAVGDANRNQEAGEDFAKAVAADGRLAGLVSAFQAGNYNTVLVVDAGLGPQKIGTGPDNSIAAFRMHSPSDYRGLVVGSSAGDAAASYPWVCDVNRMAAQDRWNHLEEVRVAKSVVGSGLMLGGAGALAYGAQSHNEAAAIAGASALVVGAVLKAGAHADTRYDEMLPQRVYVVPLKITSPNTTVVVQIEGEPSTGLAVVGLSPPKGPAGQLRYVRLVGTAIYAPPWAKSGRVVYSNDRTGEAPGPQLPYILGGQCVRTPTQEVLESYQRSGYLTGMALEELKALYRAEGIKLDVREEGGTPGLHVLEGGQSMTEPLDGTVGFDRLFCQWHPPYRAKSREVQELAQRIRQAGGVAPAR